MKSLFHLLILPLLLHSSVTRAESLPGKGVIVQPAVATWSSGFFLEALFARALQELGYSVMQPKMLSPPIFYRAVEQGDVDYWANGWFPLHHSFLNNDEKGKAIAIGTIVDREAIQGYLVSKREAEKYNIVSLDDFKREEVREAFDYDGNGMANLVACTPGWECAKVIAFHMEKYGLKGDIESVDALYDANMAAAIARYNAGKPIFFYTWAPNWTLYKLKAGEDVVWINVPEIVPYPTQVGYEKYMVQEGLKGAITDPCKLGFVANDIRAVANKRFLEKNPPIKKLFSLISLPIDDISRQSFEMYEGKNKRGDIAKAVERWIEKNRTTWDRWIEESKAAVTPNATLNLP